MKDIIVISDWLPVQRLFIEQQTEKLQGKIYKLIIKFDSITVIFHTNEQVCLFSSWNH